MDPAVAGEQAEPLRIGSEERVQLASLAEMEYKFVLVDVLSAELERPAGARRHADRRVGGITVLPGVDFVWVEDLLAALERLPARPSVAGEVYSVGGLAREVIEGQLQGLGDGDRHRKRRLGVASLVAMNLAAPITCPTFSSFLSMTPTAIT
jgi:hypothetical protein